MKFLRVIILTCFGLSSGGLFRSLAAAPVLDGLFPAAIQIGGSNSVTAIGKFDPWPPQVWVDSPGLVFHPTTNSGVFHVELGSNAPVGPHFVRMFNGEGASALRFLIVTHDPQTAEVEPNDAFTKPQAIERLPATVNGRLEKSGDVDSFSVKFDAGQTLIASVEAYTLLSPLDAVLRLVDGRGVTLAQNHDDGRTLDPRLIWTARNSGTYVLQLFGFDYPAGSDVRFAGNAKCVYRLYLSNGPYIGHTLPLGVRRGEKTRLRLVGWNFGAETNREFLFDGVGLGPDIQEAVFTAPGYENSVSLPVGDGPESIEQEPNNARGEANPLDVPGAVTGCIELAGDVDYFKFSAKEGEMLALEVQSASLGFPLDAWLKIEDASGKELARNDDSGSADPKLDWKAPVGTNFFAVVGGLIHRGSSDYLYRLSATHPMPAVKVIVTDNAYTIEPGKTNELKFTVTRSHGYSEKLKASLKDLPPGVSAEPVEVSEKGGDALLKLVAAPDAKPFSGSIQAIVTETATSRERVAINELISAGENNGVPQGYKHLAIESVDRLWLTVLAPPKPDEDKAKK